MVPSAPFLVADYCPGREVVIDSPPPLSSVYYANGPTTVTNTYDIRVASSVDDHRPPAAVRRASRDRPDHHRP